MTQRNRRSARASPLALTHPNAAGIDIGSASHFVAVPPDRDDQPVREFRSFTAELERLADWLGECGIDTVAMESTGVYWIASVRAARRTRLHRAAGQRAPRQERHAAARATCSTASGCSS